MVAPLTPEGARQLETRFEKLLEQDADECTGKGCGSLARWRGMLKQWHAREACIRVIILPDHPLPSGFERLWGQGLLHLTAEARVLEWPWCQLFRDRVDVLHKAQIRLRQFRRPDLAVCRCLNEE